MNEEVVVDVFLISARPARYVCLSARRRPSGGGGGHAHHQLLAEAPAYGFRLEARSTPPPDCTLAMSAEAAQLVAEFSALPPDQVIYNTEAVWLPGDDDDDDDDETELHDDHEQQQV